MGMKQKQKPERVNAPQLSIVSDDKPEMSAPQLLSTKSLSELGPNLPVGVATPDGRVRPFRLRPFKMKQEKALARLRDEAKGGNTGGFVADVLAHMLQTVGPHNFDTMKDGDRQLAINQL